MPIMTTKWRKAPLSSIILSSMILTVHGPATAQVYVLVNDQGRSILISGEKSRAPEVVIAGEMRKIGGSGWKVQFSTNDKVCWARRWVDGIFQPDKWVVETGATKQLAEKAAIEAANVLSARPDYSYNSWEGSGCNAAQHAFRNLDLEEIQKRTQEPSRNEGPVDQAIRSTKEMVRPHVVMTCDRSLPSVHQRTLDRELRHPQAQRTEHARLKTLGTKGLPPCVVQRSEHAGGPRG